MRFGWLHILAQLIRFVHVLHPFYQYLQAFNKKSPPVSYEYLASEEVLNGTKARDPKNTKWVQILGVQGDDAKHKRTNAVKRRIQKFKYSIANAKRLQRKVILIQKAGPHLRFCLQSFPRSKTMRGLCFGFLEIHRHGDKGIIGIMDIV